MTTETVLTASVDLHPQLIQDTLTSQGAIAIVRDWLSETFGAAVTVRSWSPYWKEVELCRPGNISVVFRFRLGGPLVATQSNGWDTSSAEQARAEAALVPLLEELGRAMAQQRVANAVQSRYPGVSRQVREDDTIVLQFRTPAPNGRKPPPLVDMAVVVRPDQTIDIFARCEGEAAGRATIRRLLANLQVAGIPLGRTKPIPQRC